MDRIIRVKEFLTILGISKSIFYTWQDKSSAYYKPNFMLKTVDDKIFSIINRKLPLEKRFKKLTSNARNVLYTLIIKSKNENKEITLTTFNSESVFNLKRDLFIKAINELIKVDYLKRTEIDNIYMLKI